MNQGRWKELFLEKTQHLKKKKCSVLLKNPDIFIFYTKDNELSVKTGICHHEIAV